MPRYLLPLLAIAVLLPGCASTPDPAVVCTAEWIEPRADRALERIESRAGKAFRNMRKAAASYVSGGTPGPLTLLSLRRSLDSLEDELRDGPGARDLRLLARTCNDPDFIGEQVNALLERNGVSDRALAFLDGTGLLDRIVAITEGTEDAAQR